MYSNLAYDHSELSLFACVSRPDRGRHMSNKRLMFKIWQAAYGYVPILLVATVIVESVPPQMLVNVLTVKLCSNLSQTKLNIFGQRMSM